jgi:hypothetical protein
LKSSGEAWLFRAYLGRIRGPRCIFDGYAIKRIVDFAFNTPY